MKNGKYINAMRATHEPIPIAPPKRTMAEIKLTRLRRACIVREIASLELLVADAASLLGLSEVTIYKMAKDFDIKFTRYGEKDTPLQAAVRKAYEQGIGPSIAARRYGVSPKTFMVVACKLGLTDQRRDPFKFVRGFEVPSDKRDEYHYLVKRKGLTSKEAGSVLGLLAPSPAPRYTGSTEARP